MADPNDVDNEFEEEVETNLAIEQGLGVGARELASIGESGAKDTLERGDEEGVGPVDDDIEIGGAGRAQRKED